MLLLRSLSFSNTVLSSIPSLLLLSVAFSSLPLQGRTYHLLSREEGLCKFLSVVASQLVYCFALSTVLSLAPSRASICLSRSGCLELLHFTSYLFLEAVEIIKKDRRILH